MSKYLLDSNVFIQAHRDTYPLDVVTSFWNKIKELAKNGVIISLDKVRKEIFDKSSHEDELSNWCKKNLEDTFFYDSSDSIQNYISIIQWASSQTTRYNQSAIDEFLETDLADSWIVSFAKKNDFTIVTYEKGDLSRKRIKIPDVCIHFNVRCITPIEMFRELKETI